MKSNLDYKKLTASVIGQSNCDELTNNESDRQSTKRSFIKEPYARKTILKTTKDINSKNTNTGKLFKEVNSQNNIFSKAPQKYNSNTNFSKYTQQAAPKGRNSRTNNPRQYQLKKDSSDKNFSKILRPNPSVMSSKLKSKNPNISDSKDSEGTSPKKYTKNLGSKTTRNIEYENPIMQEFDLSQSAKEIIGVVENIQNIMTVSIANTDLFLTNQDIDREIINEDITYCLSPNNKPRYKEIKSSKNVVSKSDKAPKSTKIVSKFNTCKNIDKIALDRNLVFNKICYDIDELEHMIAEIMEKYNKWDTRQNGRYNTLNCPSSLNQANKQTDSDMKSIYLSSEKRVCVYRDIIKNCSRTLTDILSLIEENDSTNQTIQNKADDILNLYKISEGKQNESNKSILCNSFNSAISIDQSTQKKITSRKLSIQNLINTELAIGRDKDIDQPIAKKCSIEDKVDDEDSGYENLDESLDYGHKSNLNENVKANKPYVRNMIVCKHKDPFIRKFQDELIAIKEHIKSKDNSFEQCPYNQSKKRLKMKRSKSEIFTKNMANKVTKPTVYRAKHSSKRMLNLYSSNGIITSDSDDQSSEDTVILFPDMQASDLIGFDIKEESKNKDISQETTKKVIETDIISKEPIKENKKSVQLKSQIQDSSKNRLNRERGLSFNEERLNTIENVDVSKPKVVRIFNYRE